MIDAFPEDDTQDGPSAPLDRRRSDELTSALYDWLDLQSTPRKIFARRLTSRRLGEMEQIVMREAKMLLDQGRISIQVRLGRMRAGGGLCVTYVAERVIW